MCGMCFADMSAFQVLDGKRIFFYLFSAMVWCRYSSVGVASFSVLPFNIRNCFLYGSLQPRVLSCDTFFQQYPRRKVAIYSNRSSPSCFHRSQHPIFSSQSVPTCLFFKRMEIPLSLRKISVIFQSTLPYTFLIVAKLNRYVETSKIEHQDTQILLMPAGNRYSFPLSE